MNLDLDALLIVLKKYRELYWAIKVEELQSYLEHEQMKERDLTEEEVDKWHDARDAGFNAYMDRRCDLSMAESQLMRFLRGEPPPAAADLYKALEPYG